MTENVNPQQNPTPNINPKQVAVAPKPKKIWVTALMLILAATLVVAVVWAYLTMI